MSRSPFSLLIQAPEARHLIRKKIKFDMSSVGAASCLKIKKTTPNPSLSGGELDLPNYSARSMEFLKLP